MSTNNEQVATASSQLERHGDHIRIEMNHQHGQRPCIVARRKIYGQDWKIDKTIACNGDVDIADCRQFGKSINTDATIDTLEIMREVDFWGMTSKLARCIQAIFEEIKTNTSIMSLRLQFEFCSAIPAMDLRYFFQNNQSLREVSLLNEFYCGPVSRAQVTHISTALRDLSLKKICINCSGFIHNGELVPILSACQKMEGLWLYDLPGHFTSIAEWLGDPMTLVQELHLHCHDDLSSEYVDDQIHAIFWSLMENVNLKVLRVRDLFLHDYMNRCFKHLLCNTATIDSICRSNHTLQKIRANYIGDLEWENEDDDSPSSNHSSEQWQPFLTLNKNPNKKKVAQAKVMQFYFSGKFDVSSISNMPLSVLAHIMGIDVQNKQSAIFNILKSVPELCAVSSRCTKLQGSLSNGCLGDNKRRKIDS